VLNGGWQAACRLDLNKTQQQHGSQGTVHHNISKGNYSSSRGRIATLSKQQQQQQHGMPTTILTYRTS
jgi:hypothetical protein